MRSMRWLAAVTGTLVLGSACGGGDSVGPNQAPAANFTTAACTANTACQFTDASTDDKAVTGWTWDFNDPTSGAANASSAQNPTHTFAAAGTYNVKLTATDADGATGEKINPVIVSAGNTAPTAGFTYSCNASICTFTNTSTDADGTIASYAWDFGQPGSGTNNTSNLKDPTHNYAVAAATDFTVTLTVTDNAGATDVETQTVRVTQDLVCTGADCTIVLSSAAKISITVSAVDCEFNNNKLEVVQPIQELVFADGCKVAENTVYSINAGAAFPAGTSLQTRFTQGTKPRPADPDPGPAATRVSGSFPNWTIEIDDGGGVGQPGEPDFNDIVLQVTATP